MVTNESFDMQNTSLLICLLLSLTNVRTVSDLSGKKMIICGVPHVCMRVKTDKSFER